MAPAIAITLGGLEMGVLWSLLARFARRAGVSALLAAGLVLTPLGAGASGIAEAAAPRKAPPVVIIVTGPTPVKADGSTWNISLIVTGTSKSASVAASLERSSAAGTELHTWYLSNLPASSMSGGSGTWKFDPPRQSTSPLLSVNVTFHETKKTSAQCSSGNETNYAGKLVGSMSLSTGLKTGTVKVTSVTFGQPTSAVYDTNCVQAKPPCASETSWTDGSALGNSIKASDVATLVKIDPLSKPAGAFRIDAVVADEPGVTLSGTSLKIATRAGSLITGQASMTEAGPPIRHASACYIDGVKHTEHLSEYFGLFRSSPLEGHTMLTGTISTAKSAYGTVTFQTVS